MNDARLFRIVTSAACAITVGLAACTVDDVQVADLEVPLPDTIDVPAGADAAQPFVAADARGFVVSWTEPADSGHALRFARLSAGQWSGSRTVARGEHWFVNWADFPSVVPIAGDGLAAHWLQRSGPGTYAYDVMITRSADGGTTWSDPVRPHRDATLTEHGFVSLFDDDGDLGVVWLDGRRYADRPARPATNEMTVRFANIADRPAAETLLDSRACDCCQTDVAVTATGPVLVYRDRSDAEIRDIAITRRVDGEWTEPRPVFEDGWHITGCPVNGPQADAAGNSVVVAWYTQAADTARVRLTFSSDAGATFGAPLQVDDGAPIGRPDVLLLGEGRALVVWLERSGEEAELRARVVAADGAAGASRVIAGTSAQRASGFPRMARHGNQVLLAWTETGRPSRVRAARLTFD